MKILFVLNTPGFLRYFDETLTELLDRGHEIDLAFTRPDLRAEALDVLPQRPGLTVLGGAPRRTDAFAAPVDALRVIVDYLRYLDPTFAQSDFLRTRRKIKALDHVPALARLRVRRSNRLWLGSLIRALLVLERAVPSAPDVERYVETSGADLVLVSPLVNAGSPQTDYVKSAKALGLPAGVCVASWDNLTTKGLIRVLPDVVMVWNEAQRDEAVRMHRIPPERVVVTGAQPFDRWFGRTPSTTRAEFCRRVGFADERPFALFVGSTSNIARPQLEEGFVERWIEAIRSSPLPAVRELGLLVRPHPDRAGTWEQIDRLAGPNTTRWPREDINSVAPDARADLFDSLHHAAVVVGINTSAMIEAAVVGRPVLTITAPEFEQAQHGTLHFRYLLPENGGFVEVARDLDEHIAQLATVLADPGAQAPRLRAFVERFVRPNGIERAARPQLVDAIERLGMRGRSAPQSVPAPLAPLQRLILAATPLVAESPETEEGRRRSKTRVRALTRPLRRRANRLRARGLGPPAAALDRLIDALEARSRERAAELKHREKSRSLQTKRRSRDLKGELKG